MNKLKYIACISILTISFNSSQSYAAKLKIIENTDNVVEQVEIEDKNEDASANDIKRDGLKIKGTSKKKVIETKEEKKEIKKKGVELSKKNNTKNIEPVKEKQSQISIDKPTRKKAFAPINLSSQGVRISSPYGPRKAPTKGASSFHNGVDIAAPKGTLIKAVNDGVVVYARSSGGSGNQITIDHGNGVKTIYKHMSKRSVNVGDKVLAGHIIGTVGNTGISTGPHLHFEVHFNGIKRNPSSIINRK